MNRSHRMILTACVLAMPVACDQGRPLPDCSREWQETVEAEIGTGDGQGHGPDIGSEEWKSVVEFRLGVRGQEDVPDRASESWCVYVQALLDERKDEGG